MLKSDQLKQARAAKAEQAQALIDLPTPTTEQTAQAQALTDEIRALGPQIENAITIESALRDRPAPTPGPAQPQPERPAATIIAFPRNAKLKAFTSAYAGRSADENAYRSGKWLQAALFGNAKAHAWCQEHGVYAFGTQQVIYNVHEEGANTTGGALVPDEMEQAIIDLREEYGAFRKFAKIVPMSSDYKTRPRRTGGLTAYALGESGAFTESSKTWDNISLTAKKWGVLAKYSSELGEDAIISIADDLAQESAYAFAVAEDNAGFVGTGAATYHGIVGVVQKFINNPTFAGVANAAATHDNFAEIDADDLDLLVSKLPLYAQRNARFFVGPVGKALAFDPILRAAGGNTQRDIAGRKLDSYLGYPIEQAVAMPNSATGNYDESPLILFGDMSAAVSMGVRRGVTVQILNELYAANGQIGVIASERFDINVHDIGDGTNAGPIVALHGETS